MKAKRKVEEPTAGIEEVADLSYAPSAPAPAERGMVRTQIYLTASEHAFLQREASRSGDTMAGLIRRYIDEKMEVPDEVWTKNSLLDPPAADPTFVGHEDDAINHDHYIYGAPKRYKKVRGKWVEQPLIKE
jgi:hypothetical protein